MLNPAVARASFAAALLAATAAGQSIRETDRAELERGPARLLARTTGGRYATLAATCPYTKTQITLPTSYTGTGFAEIIQVMTPCGYDPAGPLLPLIVAWNGYGLSANSFFNGMSDIPDEANARGWLLVAVTAIDDKSFGWQNAQNNVEKAIEYVLANYRADPDRIYGVGWSAGGGSIAAYAARHLDPVKPMMAAIATNAGTYNLVNVYQSEVPAVQSIMAHPNLFQGPPSGATLWNYLRSESEDWNASGVLEPSSQMRNLRNVPVLHVYSTDDSIPYLPLQNLRFRDYLTAKGYSISSTAVTGAVPSHSWSLLDAVATLDFFQPLSVERSPETFEVNIDRNATYYWANVTQAMSSTFSALVANAVAATNRIELSAAVNLARIELHPDAALFDPNAAFTLAFESESANATTLVVEGVTQEPTYVLNGIALVTNWTFDAAADELELTVVGPGAWDFTVRYDAYGAALAGPAAVALGANAPLLLSGGAPGQPYFMMIGFAEGFTPLALADPTDDRYVLLGMSPLPIFFTSALGPAGSAALSLAIPNDAGLLGLTLRNQFVTFPGATHLVDRISNRHDLTLGILP